MIRVAEKINPQKYGKLLSKTLPVIIKTEKKTTARFRLIGENKLSLEESVLLELLGKLIADFEEKFYQSPAKISKTPLSR